MTTENVVTTSELADWLRCDESTVRDYTSRGVIAALKRGRYPLRESVASVVSHLRAVAAMRAHAKSGAEDDPNDLTQQRALLANAQRRKLEREERIALGQLLDSSEAERAWFEQLRSVRDALMNIPDRIGPQLVGVDNLHDVRQLLLTEITAVCTELSE